MPRSYQQYPCARHGGRQTLALASEIGNRSPGARACLTGQPACRAPLPLLFAIFIFTDVTAPVCCRALVRFVKMHFTMWLWEKKGLPTIPLIFSSVAQKNQKKVAFVFEGQSWTFKEVRSQKEHMPLEHFLWPLLGVNLAQISSKNKYLV